MSLDATGMREGQGDAASCGTTRRDATAPRLLTHAGSPFRSLFWVYLVYFVVSSPHAVFFCVFCVFCGFSPHAVLLLVYLVYFVVSSPHAVLFLCFLCVLCILWFLFFTCSSVRSVRWKMAFMTQRLHRCSGKKGLIFFNG